MKFLAFFFLSFELFAFKVPEKWQNLSGGVEESFFLSNLSDQIQSHNKTLEDLLDEVDDRKYRLDRYDLQFGLSSEGEFGVLSVGGEGAVEFIWQRNLLDGDAGDDIDEQNWIERTIEVDWTTQSSDIEKSLISETNKIVDLSKLKPRLRKRIIRKFRKDAEKLRKSVKELVLMPRVGDWYIGGFFQNYNFSKGFSLGIVDLGYDLRIRFRFKVNSIPLLYRSVEDFSRKQKKLRALMLRFNKMGKSSSGIHHQFRLKRVWAIHDKSFDLDLGLVNLGSTRGLQIEYKRLDDDIAQYYFEEFPSISKGLFSVANAVNNRFVAQFDKKYIEDRPNELSLHQIRMKYTGSLEFGIEILTLGKSKTLEFHYKR